jgi:hypothetical protein
VFLVSGYNETSLQIAAGHRVGRLKSMQICQLTAAGKKLIPKGRGRAGTAGVYCIVN